MKITKPGKNYFYFSLDNNDFQKDYLNCKKFINAFMKEFSGGKNRERFWLKKMNVWAIKNDCRQRFQQLLEKYFEIEKQESLID